MITKAKLERFVESKNEGLVHYIDGPCKLMTFQVWEIWVKDGQEFFTRFVIEEENEPLLYFDDFAKLVARISERAVDLNSPPRFSNS